MYLLKNSCPKTGWTIWYSFRGYGFLASVFCELGVRNNHQFVEETSSENMVKKNETGLISENDFHSKDNLKRIQKKEKKFKCGCCDQRFTDRCDLKIHMRIHTGEKPFQCDLCAKKFTRKHHLDNHLKIHTGEKSFKCDYCGKKFAEKGNWKRHLKVHTGEKSFQCEYCEKTFAHKHNLTRHAKIHI